MMEEKRNASAAIVEVHGASALKLRGQGLCEQIESAARGLARLSCPVSISGDLRLETSDLSTGRLIHNESLSKVVFSSDPNVIGLNPTLGITGSQGEILSLFYGEGENDGSRAIPSLHCRLEQSTSHVAIVLKNFDSYENKEYELRISLPDEAAQSLVDAALPVPNDLVIGPSLGGSVHHDPFRFGLIVVRKEDRFLLIQEAKPSCRGSWYLPAGRIEAQESFVAGIRRELREEAGISVEPSGLLRVDRERLPDGSVKSRIIFYSTADEGEYLLKSTPDRHSLRAEWFTPEEIQCLPLRSREVLRLIEQVVRDAPIYPLSFLEKI